MASPVTLLLTVRLLDVVDEFVAGFVVFVVVVSFCVVSTRSTSESALLGKCSKNSLLM